MMKHFLAYLLHHANREYKDERFYQIKDRILSRHGAVVGYDVQFIEGKRCRSCGGCGYHERISWESGRVYDTVDCYHCWGGWYKRPTWVLLQRIQFGKYLFHKPIQRESRFVSNPFTKEQGWNVSEAIIQGYIEHSRTKFGKDARVALYLLYDWRGYWKRWYKHIGRGWRCGRWWLHPRSWPNNIAHVIRYGRRAIPIKRFFEPRVRIGTPTNYSTAIQPEDLPF
jgi:hypothetical protein